MQKFEYCVVELHAVASLGGTWVDRDNQRTKVGGHLMKEAVGVLNQLGTEGWEVAGYTATGENASAHFWTLKRAVG